MSGPCRFLSPLCPTVWRQAGEAVCSAGAMVRLQSSLTSHTVIGHFHWPRDHGLGSQTTTNGALDVGDFRFYRHLFSAFHRSRLGQVTSQHPQAGSVPAPWNAPTVPVRALRCGRVRHCRLRCVIVCRRRRDAVRVRNTNLEYRMTTATQRVLDSEQLRKHCWGDCRRKMKAVPEFERGLMIHSLRVFRHIQE